MFLILFYLFYYKTHIFEMATCSLIAKHCIYDALIEKFPGKFQKYYTNHIRSLS